MHLNLLASVPTSFYFNQYIHHLCSSFQKLSLYNLYDAPPLDPSLEIQTESPNNILEQEQSSMITNKK
jgi:hypothetical protein